MPLQDKIRSAPPSEGEKQVVKEQARVLDNQLEHLLSVYDFVQKYNQLGIEPDELHRTLFQRTSLTPRGFKMRMTKASRASEVIGSMIETKEYYPDIREDLSIEDSDEYTEVNFEEIFFEQGFDYVQDLQLILEESRDEVFIEDYRNELSDFYSTIDSSTFDEVARHFDKMAEWYESVLLEENLISEGEEHTPSLPVLTALCVIYLSGMMMIAIGYDQEDAFKIMAGMNALAMGFLAFAAL